MHGGPPSYGDLNNFHQHLNVLSNQLNVLHEQSGLGGYLQSPFFSRSKFELFALQHVQLMARRRRAGRASPA